MPGHTTQPATVRGPIDPSPLAEKDPKPNRRHLWAVRLLALGISLSIGLIFIEGALRVMGVRPAARQYGDALLGFVTPPNLTETFVFPEYGGPLTMKTNNMGFHEDQDTALVKAPGVTRIVAIGDSQTAGECTNSENYPNLFGAALNRTGGGAKFEIVNAGTGRYSPYQYYVKTAHQLVQLKPDHLIVGLYMGNDFMDLIRQDDRPYLTREADGSVKAHSPQFMMYEDPNDAPGILASTRIASLTKQVLGPTFLYQARRAKLLWHDAASDHGTADVVRYMLEVKKLTDISLGFMTQSMLQQVWFHRFPKTLDDALYLNRYVMSRFRDLCRQNGIRLTYVLVPTKLEIEPDDMGVVLQRVRGYDSAYTLDGLRAFEDRLTERVLHDCAELNIPAIDLRKSMRERRNGTQLYYPEEMHLNPAGNRVISATLHDVLAPALQ